MYNISMNELLGGEVLQTPLPYVVHGSFRRHLDQIGAAIETIDATGLAVAIAPHDCVAVGEQNGFVLFSGEEGKDPREVEAEYLKDMFRAMAGGGFSLFVNPGGYVGKSAAYEAGIIQASGGRAIFTETPDDVPFYVNPANIMRPEELAEVLARNDGLLPAVERRDDPVADIWNHLPFNTAAVAVGGVVAFRGKVLLAEDGRWGDKLTVPGTTVRAGESRDAALNRAMQSKFGVSVRGVDPLAVSFMIEDSGYGKPVRQLVFDDRAVRAASSKTNPEGGISAHWVSTSELEAMLEAGQIEPNAAALLASYLTR